MHNVPTALALALSAVVVTAAMGTSVELPRTEPGPAPVYLEEESWVGYIQLHSLLASPEALAAFLKRYRCSFE